MFFHQIRRSHQNASDYGRLNITCTFFVCSQNQCLVVKIFVAKKRQPIWFAYYLGIFQTTLIIAKIFAYYLGAISTAYNLIVLHNVFVRACYPISSWLWCCRCLPTLYIHAKQYNHTGAKLMCRKIPGNPLNNFFSFSFQRKRGRSRFCTHVWTCSRNRLGIHSSRHNTWAAQRTHKRWFNARISWSFRVLRSPHHEIKTRSRGRCSRLSLRGLCRANGTRHSQSPVHRGRTIQWQPVR